jgi:hypothetical protein
MDAMAGKQVVGGVEDPLTRVVRAQLITLAPVFGIRVYRVPPIVRP